MLRVRFFFIFFVIKLCSLDAECASEKSAVPSHFAQINICAEANKENFPESKLTIASHFSANGSPLELKISNGTKKGLWCQNVDEFGLVQNIQSDKNENQETEIQVMFFDSGILEHKVGSISTFYESYDYCLLRLNERFVEVKVCMADCDPGKNVRETEVVITHPNKNYTKPKPRIPGFCIFKCCPPDQVLEFNGTETVCRNSGPKRWTPTFFDSRTVDDFCISRKEMEIERESESSNGSGMRSKFQYHIQNFDWTEDERERYRIPRLSINLGNGEFLPRHSFRLLETGQLVMENIERSPAQRFSQSRWLENHENFCIDGLQNIEDSGQLYSGEIHHSAILGFLNPDEDGETETEAELLARTINGTGNDTNTNTTTTTNEREDHSEPTESEGVSVMCVIFMYFSLLPLSLTLLAYWITWSTENIHGWTLFMHVLSLFFMDLFLGTIHLNSVFQTAETNSTACVALGILSHFFFLSTFFWLTMVNLDFWMLFRTLEPSSNRAKGIRRFICYAVFSWGGPIVIISIGLILDSVHGARGIDSDCDLILPNYGLVRCYLHRDAEGAYLYFIIGILIICNTVFFALTASALCKFHKRSQKARKGKSKSDAEQAKLLIKLFMVMGVSFVFEFISWAVQMNRGVDEADDLGWVIFNCVNWIARAIFIFVIFACKRKTVDELRKRLSSCPCLLNVLNKVEFSRTDTEQTNTGTLERSSTVKLSVLKRKKNSDASETGNTGLKRSESQV